LASSCSDSAKQRKKQLGKAQEQFVPAQSLRLVDKGGQFGEIDVHSNGLELWLGSQPNGEISLWYASWASRPYFGGMVTLYGKERPSGAGPEIKIFKEPLSYSVRLPRGQSITTTSKEWDAARSSSWFSATVKAGYESVFPPKPETTIDKEIPAEDVRLVDKDGDPVLICGLSENADPGIAFLNRDGSLGSVLSVGERAGPRLGYQKEWLSFAVFGRYGKLKLLIRVGEDADSVLTIFEEIKPGTPEPYTLDATNGQEIPVRGLDEFKPIPWLRQTPRIRLPIQLIDERNKVLWISGS